MQLRKLKSALVRTYADVESNHTLQMAAALSYYFVMALFPAMIFLSAIVAFLPFAGGIAATSQAVARLMTRLPTRVFVT